MKSKRNAQFRGLVFTVSLLALAGIGRVYAGSAAVDVNVTFERALVVIAGDPIQFGSVLANGNAGTVFLDKDTGNVTWSGGALNVGNSNRGNISFIGPRPGNVGITFPTQVDLINSQDPERTVTFSPAPEVTTKTISEFNQEVVINVGGTLNFGTNIREGLYNGSVQIEVNYN